MGTPIDVRPGLTPAGTDGLNPQRRRAGRGVAAGARIVPVGLPRAVLIERPLRRRTERRAPAERPERPVETTVLTDERTLAARIVAVSAFPPRSDGPKDAWLAQRGPALIEKYPPLAVVAAWRYLLSGHPDEAIEMADLSDRATFEGAPSDGSASFESQRARLRAVMARRGPRAMLDDARLALSEEHPGSPWRAVALVLLGQAHAALGDPETADAAYRDEIMTGTSFAPAPAVLALAGRASLRVDQGNWGAADAFIRDSRIQLFRAISARPRHRSLSTPSMRASPSSAATSLGRARPSPVVRASPRWPTTRCRTCRSKGSCTSPRPPSAVPRSGRPRRSRHAEQIMRRRPHLGSLATKLTGVRCQVEDATSSLVGSSMFTPAELRVLQFLPTHLSFQDIGDRLSVSRNTVKTHAMSIYGKLWASSRNEAVERAVQLGLLEPIRCSSWARPDPRHPLWWFCHGMGPGMLMVTMPEPTTVTTPPIEPGPNDYAAILARFPDEATAMTALKSLQSARTRGEVTLDDVIVVRAGPGARLQVRVVGAPGLSEGVRVGAVFGMLLGSFFPKSRLVQTIAWAFIGAYVGTLQQEARKAHVAAALTGTLSTNEAGILRSSAARTSARRWRACRAPSGRARRLSGAVRPATWSRRPASRAERGGQPPEDVRRHP